MSSPDEGALLTDLYQLTMLQAYFDQGMADTAVFEFFVRKLPAGRNFLVAAGLEQAIDYLEGLRFAPDELEWLAHCGRFHQPFVDSLADLRFTGEIHALAEGTVFFPNEPLLRAVAFTHDDTGQHGLLLMVIDPGRLEAEVKYEPGTDKPDELFPHVFGRINLDAVTRVLEFEPDAAGKWSLPAL